MTEGLLSLTVTMTVSTVVAAAVAWVMPIVAGEQANPVVGIRTKATLSSDKAWRLAHRVARPALRWTVWAAAIGLVMQLALGLVLRFDSIFSAALAVTVCVVAYSVLIYAGMIGNSAAKRYMQTGCDHTL